ncbi:MAG: amidohydrolase family protein, partial [Bacillota bacterium]|nr:amidohydrolase family protein [Bacillota bacterium]
GQPPKDNMLIIIEDNIIKSIKAFSEKDIPENALYFNLEGNTILPGLIDSHVHLALNGETSFDTLMLKELIPYQAIRASEYARRDLFNGFTTIRAVGDKGFIDVALRQSIDKGYVVGPRIVASGHMLSITGGRDNFPPEISYEDNLWTECDGPDGVARATRLQLKYDVDWIKLGVTGAVTAGGGLPGAQQFTEAEIRSAVECAKMYGKKVSGHAHSAEGVKAALKAGVDSIEHGLLIDEEALHMFVKKGAYWVPTFIPIHNILKHGVENGIPQSMIDRTVDVSENHKAKFKKALEIGVKIVMGTDSGMPFTYHGENAAEIELMVENGMSEMNAILSATSTASEMLGLDKQIGKIQEGMLADIIAVEDDPLENINALKKVRFVMKDGSVIKSS